MCLMISNVNRSGYETIKFLKNSQQMLWRLTCRKSTKGRENPPPLLKSALVLYSTQSEFSEDPSEDKLFFRIQILSRQMSCGHWNKRRRGRVISFEKNHRKSVKFVNQSCCYRKILLTQYSVRWPFLIEIVSFLLLESFVKLEVRFL